MSERYDIAIIGSGPAGLSAAINAKIRNKKVVVFGQKNYSNKLIKAAKINNYLGFYDISGLELKEKFAQHIEKMDIEILYERINNVYSMGEYFALMVNEKMYEATTVILATGVEFSKSIKGEDDFLGRGVGYCATCDAPLYKDKVVTVVGYNNEAEHEANYVSELASKLYYVPMYRSEYNLDNKIEVISDTPIEVKGDSEVKQLILKEREINTDGVFFLRDTVAPDQLVPGLEVEGAYIKVNRNMETNIAGLYAAGDCIGKPYQYIKAAGEGQIASLNAVAYLDKIKK